RSKIDADAECRGFRDRESALLPCNVPPVAFTDGAAGAPPSRHRASRALFVQKRSGRSLTSCDAAQAIREDFPNHQVQSAEAHYRMRGRQTPYDSAFLATQVVATSESPSRVSRSSPFVVSNAKLVWRDSSSLSLFERNLTANSINAAAPPSSSSRIRSRFTSPPRSKSRAVAWAEMLAKTKTCFRSLR